MIRLIILLSLLIGCASKKKEPDYDVKWENKMLMADVKSGSKSKAEVDHQLMMDKNGCMVEALKIAIPSPTCTQQTYYPRAFDSGNSVLNSYMAGAAAGRAASGPDCDYSSVKYAHKAQEQVFFSCMAMRDWNDIWLIKGTNVVVPKPDSRSMNY
jgi:hypothetical protein